MKEEMSPFFMAVAELAENKGFEVEYVKGGALHLNLNGEKNRRKQEKRKNWRKTMNSGSGIVMEQEIGNG